MLSRDARLRPNDEAVIGKVLDGEAILINLASGSYYALPGAGAVIWEAIVEQCALHEIALRVGALYDVSAERAGADIEALAARLLQEGLVVPATGEPPPRTETPTSPATPAPYVTPELTAYSDMRNLLALDPPMPSIDNLTGPRGDAGGSNES